MSVEGLQIWVEGVAVARLAIATKITVAKETAFVVFMDVSGGCVARGDAATRVPQPARARC